MTCALLCWNSDLEGGAEMLASLKLHSCPSVAEMQGAYSSVGFGVFCTSLN